MTHTWEELLEDARNHVHKSLDGYTSCSTLTSLAICGAYESSDDSSEIAVIGTAQHYMQEIGYLPDDAPDNVKRNYRWAKAQQAKFGGYTVYNREQFYKDDEFKICGSVDLELVASDNLDDFVLIDWKFGWNIVVADVGQMAGYALLRYRNQSPERPIKRLRTAIVQPEMYHFDIKEWTEAEATEVVAECIENAARGEEEMNPSACRYCARKLNGCKKTSGLFRRLRA